MENINQKSLGEKIREVGLQKFLAPAALVILYIFFGIFGRNFFSYTTLVNILDSSYYIGFIAIGVTFVIITGGIDLSCGTVMMCAAIIGGTAYKSWGWPMWISLILIMVVAIAFGFFQWDNGFPSGTAPLYCHSGNHDDFHGCRIYCFQC